MNRQNIELTAKIVASDTQELYDLAASKGIILPHPSLGIFKSILAEIEKPNANGVRLGKDATVNAIDTLIGTQINRNHLRAGNVLGHIIDSSISGGDIEIVCIFFKDIYQDEYAEAMDLFKENELTMSFELSADVQSQDKLQDGTKRLNDYYFTGAGLLFGVAPACKKARVYEMATKNLYNQLNVERQSLIFANSQKTKKSIMDILSLMTRKAEEITVEETDAQEPISETEDATKWTTKFINDLPNSSFAVIEPAYLDGKTDNKNARHLPYKNASGEIDLPHYRNALARANQIKPVTDSISTEDLRKKAVEELNKHRDVLKSSENKGETIMNEEQKNLILALRTELGDYLPKETKDEDLLVEAKVAEFRKIKEDAIKAKEEADKKVADEAANPVEEIKTETTVPVAEAKAEETDIEVKADVVNTPDNMAPSTTVREETTKVTDTVDPTAGTEKVTVETTCKVTQDGQPVAENKSVSETVYTYAQVEAIKAEYEQKLVAKDAEIVKIKETADKLATSKLSLKDNEFAKDFTDADYLDDTKVENAKLKLSASQKETVVAEKEVILSTGHKKEDASEEFSSPLSKVLKNKHTNKR